MKELNTAQITVKCVEISKSLVNTETGLHDFDLANTRSIGDAARFATSIKRSNIISQEQLAAIASALKIDFRILRSELLPLFEEFGWIETKKVGPHIKRIDEMIPPIDDVLSRLGKQWHENEPTVIDSASVVSLSKLSRRPIAKDALVSELDITDEDFEIVYNYGEQARYFGKFISSEYEVETIWTPLYWSDNAAEVLKFLTRQSYEQFANLESLTERLVSFPGKPIELFGKGDLDLLQAGISHGYFPTVGVYDRRGKSYSYVFPTSPQFDLDPNKDVFERARLIVACIRHGQYHAEVSKILYPTCILNAMRENRMKPHPYARIQYFLLKLLGVVDIIPAKTKHGDAYKVVWIDSPENNLAGDIAEELLRGQAAATGTVEDLEARKILVEGVYSYTSEQRRIRASKSIAADKEFNRLIEQMTGVKV